jgi:hypothetical protein
MFVMRSLCSWAIVGRTSAVRGILAALLLCGMMAGMASQAQARIFIGLGLPLFVPPVVVPGPYYYPPYYAYPPPPAYYAPPGYAPPGNSFSYTPPPSQPQSLAPPQSYAPPPGGYTPSGGYSPSGGYTPSVGGGSSDAGSAQTCRAGAYVCPLVEDTPPGGACACPGHNGQTIRGQAN